MYTLQLKADVMSYTTYQTSATAYCVYCNTGGVSFQVNAARGTKVKGGMETYPETPYIYNAKTTTTSKRQSAWCSNCNLSSNHIAGYQIPTEQTTENRHFGLADLRLGLTVPQNMLTSGKKTSNFGSNAGWEII